MRDTSDSMDTQIWSLDGDMIDPFNPDPGMIDMHAIAVSLSNLVRYNGYVSSFYSVAQHATIMSYWAENIHEGCTPEMEKAALLHDAAETWIGEHTSPIKQTCPGIPGLEDGVARMIFAHHDLDPDLWNCAEIKELDWIMFNTEVRDIRPFVEPDDPSACIPRDEVIINPLMPPAAFDNFKLRYNRLFPERPILGNYENPV